MGWVGRWLEIMTYMLSPDLFSMLDTPTRLVSFEGTEIPKKPGFLPGVRGILLFDNGHNHLLEKKWPTALTKGDDYGVHTYIKRSISA